MHSLPIKAQWVEKLRKGYPWVYTHLIANTKTPLSPGEIVYLLDGKKRPFAIGYYNPHTTLACRILSLDVQTKIDVNFFFERFSQALAARERRFNVPYYRLIHAEGDRLPGLIIDRFGDTLVCQTSTAGMEKLRSIWLEALNKLIQPKRVIFRDDVLSRQKEGLSSEITVSIGALSAPLEVLENGATYYGDPLEGQKTGWFFDQRSNRQWVAKHCQQKSVLDLYTYSGGFGILAACQGARSVKLVDASEKALTLAKMAASANQVTEICEFIKDNVFDLLEQFCQNNETFDVVIADPPAFVKQAQHKGAGLRGYQKLAKLASQVVAPGGKLFIASCSHHANVTDFRQAVETGIKKGGREMTFLYKGGADKDHPIHPLLPESHYLKALMYELN